MTAPSYVDEKLDTALIERERAHLFPAPTPASRHVLDLAASALAQSQRAAVPGSSPWDDRDGWRLVGRARRTWKFRDGEAMRDVEVAFDGEAWAGARNVHLRGNEIHVFDGGEHRVLEWIDPYLPVQEHAGSHGGLRAPMPGRILAIMVEPGAAVKRGAPLVVMEAMKMEHTVVASAAGVVDRVLCAVGEQVKEGVELLQLRPDPQRN
jgi:3-methylcrotonyl-CoA carboxylase alpha subunit